MGPQLFSRGDFDTGVIGLWTEKRLQWGHSFSAVEMKLLFSVSFNFQLLQWGHSFSAVEI